MAIPDRQLTKDGFERTFQSNHLGHFVLTSAMFPFLSRSKATVINVSSEAYNFARGGLDINNLNGEKSYGPWTSYGLSKLSNILFTQELQRRAEQSGDSTWLTAVTLHPGAVSTDLGRYLVGEEKWNDLKTKGGPSGLESIALNALSVFTKTVPEGASTQVYLAAGADGKLTPGAFYEDLKVKNLPSFATDQSSAKQLWEKSEELGGVTFRLGSNTEKQTDDSTIVATTDTTDKNEETETS
jgi:NAD(P)-dependent dehydrogenase (short-subunit alcohol dehydrogenase family)